MNPAIMLLIISIVALMALSMLEPQRDTTGRVLVIALAVLFGAIAIGAIAVLAGAVS